MDPHPKQTGVIPGVKISEEIVRGWTTTFLYEADDLLAGRKLVPFRQFWWSWSQSPPELYRAPRDRPGPLGPGHGRCPLPGARQSHHSRGLEAAPARFWGRVPRLRDLVQLTAARGPSPLTSPLACLCRQAHSVLRLSTRATFPRAFALEPCDTPSWLVLRSIYPRTNQVLIIRTNALVRKRVSDMLDECRVCILVPGSSGQNCPNHSSEFAPITDVKLRLNSEQFWCRSICTSSSNRRTPPATESYGNMGSSLIENLLMPRPAGNGRPPRLTVLTRCDVPDVVPEAARLTGKARRRYFRLIY